MSREATSLIAPMSNETDGQRFWLDATSQA